MRAVLREQPALAVAMTTPAPAPLLAPLISPPLSAEQAEGLDLILEGFLLHHGRPRHLALEDQGAAVLAGDYCYAHGLVRIAAAGDLFHIAALADLIALGAGVAGTDGHHLLAPLWRATTAAMAARGGPDEAALAPDFAAARAALRRERWSLAAPPLERLAATIPPTPDLAEAFV